MRSVIIFLVVVSLVVACTSVTVLVGDGAVEKDTGLVLKGDSIGKDKKPEKK